MVCTTHPCDHEEQLLVHTKNSSDRGGGLIEVAVANNLDLSALILATYSLQII
jgi:hypothetical protein